MTFSSFSFKSKLALVSLVLLASQMTCFKAEAMLVEVETELDPLIGKIVSKCNKKSNTSLNTEDQKKKIIDKANQNNHTSQFQLGLMHLQGFEVEKNISRAFFWLMLSKNTDQEINEFLSAALSFAPPSSNLQNRFDHIKHLKEQAGMINYNEAEILDYIQNELKHIQLGQDKKTGLNKLTSKYKSQNKLSQKDDFISDKLTSLLEVVEDLQTQYNKREIGFMMWPLTASGFLLKANLPFLSSCELMGDPVSSINFEDSKFYSLSTYPFYINFGNDHVLLGNKVATSLKTVTKICEALQAKASLYRTGLDAQLADLMIMDTKLDLLKKDMDLAEEYSKKSLKFLQKQKDYKILDELYTKEISEIEGRDIPEIKEAARKIKEIIAKYAFISNDWFQKDYPGFAKSGLKMKDHHIF